MIKSHYTYFSKLYGCHFIYCEPYRKFYSISFTSYPILLVQRAIVILEERVADKESYFRKKFYTVTLPFVKNEGFIIFAITHDDNYYHCADYLFKMEERC